MFCKSTHNTYLYKTPAAQDKLGAMEANRLYDIMPVAISEKVILLDF